jgi:hypothetical protein
MEFVNDPLWQVKKVDACRLRLRTELSDNDAHVKVRASDHGFGFRVPGWGLGFRFGGFRVTSRGFGWRIHSGVEVTESSTDKQDTLSSGSSVHTIGAEHDCVIRPLAFCCLQIACIMKWFTHSWH